MRKTFQRKNQNTPSEERDHVVEPTNFLMRTGSTRKQRLHLSILDYQQALSWMKPVEAREVKSSHVICNSRLTMASLFHGAVLRQCHWWNEPVSCGWTPEHCMQAMSSDCKEGCMHSVATSKQEYDPLKGRYNLTESSVRTGAIFFWISEVRGADYLEELVV